MNSAFPARHSTCTACRSATSTYRSTDARYPACAVCRTKLAVSGTRSDLVLTEAFFCQTEAQVRASARLWLGARGEARTCSDGASSSQHQTRAKTLRRKPTAGVFPLLVYVLRSIDVTPCYMVLVRIRIRVLVPSHSSYRTTTSSPSIRVQRSGNGLSADIRG